MIGSEWKRASAPVNLTRDAADFGSHTIRDESSDTETICLPMREVLSYDGFTRKKVLIIR
jgi:hypothetical protein